MPRTATPLNNTQIENAKSITGKTLLLVDGQGLGLRVKPNGTKSWVFNYYRPFTKKRTNIGLGAYPHVSLKRARILAGEYRTQLEEDTDPKEYKELQARKGEREHENTFEVVYRNWLHVKEDDWSESYRDRITKAMGLHILPGLGAIPVHKITRDHGKDILKPIAERMALETVTKLCLWSSEVMEAAVDDKLISSNPFHRLRKAFKKTKSTHRPWIKPDKLPVFLKKLETATCSAEVKNLILWQLHTMVRPAEAAGAKWSEIDFENRLWVIPAERMKGRKNPNSREEVRVPHEVPLSDQAIEILKIMKPISQHRSHVFPSRSHPEQPMNSSTANVAIKRMGFKGYEELDSKGKLIPRRLCAHGLRHTASTTLNEQEFKPYVIEAALAHLDTSSMKGIYDHAEYSEQRRVMLQWWSNHIEEAATGINPSKGKKHLKVVQS